MKTPIVLLALLGLATAAAAEDGPAALLGSWLDSLVLDEGVIQELERFSRDEGEWPEGTEERLATMFRARVREDLSRALDRIAGGDLEPRVQVDYLEPSDFARGREETRDKRGRKFEEGVIRTEQVAFFPGEKTVPAKALATFVDPAFRQQTSSRIESIEESDGLSCIMTKGMWGLLDPTSSCNRIDLLDAGNVAAEHSQVVDNPGGGDFQPVYFKESVKAFVAVPEGLVLYYINYTRSAKLGSIKKKLGRGKIEDSQIERAAALAQALGGQTD